MCLHEETKRHCEAAILVHTKKRGGGVGQRDLHQRADPEKNILQLVEPISTIRPRRTQAKIKALYLCGFAVVLDAFFE